jgi:hypothetical protein
MTITRLTGGLTPADGADPRTFPAIWNATADGIEAQGSAISVLESDVADLEGGTVGGTAVYRFVETVYFTSSGTFDKADYPWLRAIKVTAVGGGGGGGGVGTTSGVGVAGGGGGGGIAESFITNIAGLDASVTVTVGAGGAGGSGNNGGDSGGNSSFDLITGGGGEGGNPSTGNNVSNAGGNGGTASGGDLNLSGFSGITSARNSAGQGGGQGGGGRPTGNSDGNNGTGNYGGGGSGAQDGGTTARDGGAGAGGRVIVELYA